MRERGADSQSSEKEQAWFYHSDWVRLFRLITDGALLLPGYAKNMPSLQSHQDTVCEVHLKVSSHRPSEAHACGLHGPGILAQSLSLTGMPGIPS